MCETQQYEACIFSICINEKISSKPNMLAVDLSARSHGDHQKETLHFESISFNCEVHEQALNSCDAMHRERRILLKHEIGRPFFSLLISLVYWLQTSSYKEILKDLKKDPERHGGPPDCILLCQLREKVLREWDLEIY